MLLRSMFGVREHTVDQVGVFVETYAKTEDLALEEVDQDAEEMPSAVDVHIGQVADDDFVQGPAVKLLVHNIFIRS